MQGSFFYFMAVKVVLDIDHVLTCSSPGGALEPFFVKSGCVIDARITHYVFPAVKEFLIALFKTESLSVAFFSAGIEERNKPFIRILLKAALGRDWYKEVKENVIVLSRNNLVEGRKDLRLILGGADCSSAVLIDDRPKNIVSGQERSFLYTKKVNLDSYTKLKRKLGEYSPEGTKPLPCVLLSTIDEADWCDVTGQFSNEDDEWCIIEQDGEEIINQQIKKASIGNSILIYKSSNPGAEFFYFHFPNAISNLQEREIVIDKELQESLDSELGLLRQSSNLIKELSGALQAKIYEYVKKKGGRTDKICRSVNRIYYVAGLFFHALEQAKKTGKTISDCLVQEQFQQIRRSSRLTSRYQQCVHNDRFYHLGLKELRKINPELRFITPEKYVELSRV